MEVVGQQGGQFGRGDGSELTGGLRRGQMPMVMPNDISAVKVAIQTCGEPRQDVVGVVHIKNTLQIGEIEISSTLLERAKEIPHLDVDPDGHELSFARPLWPPA